MVKKYMVIILIMLMAGWQGFGIACAQKPEVKELIPPSGAPTISQKPTTIVSAAGAKVPGEAEWRSVLQAAKNEGVISVYVETPQSVRGPLIDTFKEKYGIEADLYIARPAEFAERIARERRSGLYVPDIVMTGPDALAVIFKGMDIFDPIEPTFMLPELIVPEEIQKVWWRGKLFWGDSQKTALGFCATPATTMAINTELVKPRITSYRDLMDPRWKGKIIFRDPTLGAGGFRPFAMMGAVFVNWDFVRELVNKQEAVFTRDDRLMVEGLARGKYAIAFAPRTEVVVQFQETGSPVDLVVPKEGVFVNAGAGGFSLVNKAPHPNAIKLFINFLLSKEGGTLYSRAGGLQSARLDVPTDHLNPAKVRQPGINYFVPEGEKQWEIEEEWKAKVDEIVKPLMK